MTPDDKRDEGAQAHADDPSGRSQAPKSDDESGAIGLAELAGSLPSLPPGEGAGEEDADPKALAALAAQRPSAVDEKPAARAPEGRAPVAAPPERGGGWVVPLLIGIAIGAAGATAVTSLTARPESAALTAPVAEPPAAEPALAAAAEVPVAQAAPQPSEGPPAAAELVNPAPVPAEALPVVADTLTKERSPVVSRPGNSAPGSSAQPVAAAATAAPDDDEPLLPVEPPPPPPAGTLPEGKVRAMDALLDDALSPAARNQELARRQAAALATEQQLPLTPSREDANKAMTVLLPAIRGCAMGQSGLATANMVVRADGRVAGVEVTGAPFAGTASGRCMEGVIRRARFAPFRQATIRIKFPLAIQ